MIRQFTAFATLTGTPIRCAKVMPGIVVMALALSCQRLPMEGADGQSGDQPGGSAFASGPALAGSGCTVFGIPVSTETQWRYAIRWNDDTHGIAVVRVDRIDGSQMELSTTVRLPEETQIHWSATVDCESHRILAQQRPELALAFWPFPGVFATQQLDFVTEDGVFTLPARRPGSAARSISLTYGTYPGPSGGRTRVVRANDQGRTTEFDVSPRAGPIQIRFADGSALESIGAAHAAALEAILTGEDEEGRAKNPGLWPLGDPAALAALNRSQTRALTAAPAVAGAADYGGLCQSPSWQTTYNAHWPELIFTTKTGSAASSTELAGDDFSGHHDDRDSSFTFVPDDTQFAQQYEQIGQTSINVEWESAAWFPRHIVLGGNYPDPPPPAYGANRFAVGCDTSFQSPAAGDRVVVRGAAVVDCGHAPALEIHPPSALYWRHGFQKGIADFFFRASSYAWHPRIEQFTGGDHTQIDPAQTPGSQGSFEADLDVPDMVPGQTPRRGPIVVDYAVSGYEVIDDAHSVDPIFDPYLFNHPAAHLTNGDYSQPYTNYFDVSVTPNGSGFHISAKPKPPFDQPADPARPALIGFRFRACVPVNDGAGNSLNGCLPDDPLDISANDWIGQVIPARMGETLVGHFYDRHRPTEPLTFEVRVFADSCDNGHTESLLGTVTVSPPNFEFSFPIPVVTRICAPTSPGTPALEPVDGILLRPLIASDRQVPLTTVMSYSKCYTSMLSYFVPGTCVDAPESIARDGRCPPGTGFTGPGYFLCNGPLEPYCKPGASGQPGVPGTPTGVTATGGANQITVSWQPVPMTAAYQVHTSSGAVVARIRDTSVTFTGLANGFTQSYYVAGLNPDPVGEGPRSAIVTATTSHCSQTCAGCCNGETCTTTSVNTGCKINGEACGSVCPAGTDTCRSGACVCHQDPTNVCFPTVGQADYTRTCGDYLGPCGVYVSCGTCPPNYYCTGGVSAHCVCSPLTASQACGGACGMYASDGCGGSVYCGRCCTPTLCSGRRIWDPDLCMCIDPYL